MTLSLFFSVALLWIWFFWLWQDYRLDKHRQDLFSLRDELFDLASTGAIAFDDRAYGMLRSTINGAIQFGHRRGFLDLVALLVFIDPTSRRSLAAGYKAELDAAMQPLDAATVAELEEFRTSLHSLLAKQLVLTSALLMLTFVTALGVLVLYAIGRTVSGGVAGVCKRVTQTGPVTRVMTWIDSASFARATTTT